MNDETKTREQLTDELSELRKKNDELKKAEDAIYESEKRYKRLIESVTDYIYTVQVENGRPVKTTHGPGCIGVTGYATEDYDADPYHWYRMIYEKDRATVTDYAGKVLSGEIPPSFTHRIIHKDSNIRWVTNTIVPRYDDHHRLIAYDGLIKDITERIRLEEDLKKGEAKYRSLVESTDDSIYLVDRDCAYLFVNEKHLSRLGLSKDLILGKTYGEFHPSEESKEFAGIIDRVFRAGESVQYEHRSHRDNRYFVRTLSPVKEPKGKISAVTVVSKDITEHKSAEEEREKLIAELQKALGKLEIALGEVKKLSGLLPICASCKKIKDDKGYWEQIEHYISNHSEAAFSHGVCRDCAKKLYPDYYEKIWGKKEKEGDK